MSIKSSKVLFAKQALDQLRSLSTFKDVVEVRVTEDVPGVADRYVVDLLYPNDKVRTLTANTPQEITRTLRYIHADNTSLDK